MLTQLTIRNFGLIDEISIEFVKDFNILTGETGAGKSILIDALRSVLGERLDTSSIRNPASPCVIEAVFDITDKKLRELEIIKEFLNEDDHQIIIQRTHSASGTRVKLKSTASPSP